MLIEKTKNYISYGFRKKEKIPLTNGDISKIIFKANKVFKLIADDYQKLESFIEMILNKYPELHEMKKIHENRISELEIILKNDTELDDLLEKWVNWGIERDEAMRK